MIPTRTASPVQLSAPGVPAANCLASARRSRQRRRSGGLRGPKVFKLATRTVKPGRPATFTRRHRFREVFGAPALPGIHRLDIHVNGRILGGAEAELVDR
jgi:hypothetical protein